MARQEIAFELHLIELRKDADQASWFLGFIKSVVDNGILDERVEGSFSGYAVVTARAGVKNSLILYCARAWDTRDDSISLCRAVEKLPVAEELDRRRQENWRGDQPVPSLSERRRLFMANYEEARDLPHHPSIRVLRTEYFAHRVLQSKDRIRLEKQGPIINATYDNLIDLAARTLSLVGELGYLWDQTVNPYPDRVEWTRSQCAKFWHVLPVLKEREDDRGFPPRERDPW